MLLMEPKRVRHNLGGDPLILLAKIVAFTIILCYALLTSDIEID